MIDSDKEYCAWNITVDCTQGQIWDRSKYCDSYPHYCVHTKFAVNDCAMYCNTCDSKYLTICHSVFNSIHTKLLNKVKCNSIYIFM